MVKEGCEAFVSNYPAMTFGRLLFAGLAALSKQHRVSSAICRPAAGAYQGLIELSYPFQ
jgi:hypothetical protein